MPVTSYVMTLLQSSNHSAPLYVVGHSLGAAVAVLASSGFMLNHGATPAAIYTYGCPRVGNEAFAGACSLADGGSYAQVYIRNPPRTHTAQAPTSSK